MSVCDCPPLACSATANIFVFSWLLLGLCSLSLLAGGNVRKLVCEPILDEPKYTVIHKVRSHDVHGVTLYSCRVEK